MRGRAGGSWADRGSVSILFATGLTAVLMIIGLSYDAGGKLRSAAYANSLAAAAARAGAQDIDITSAIEGGPKVIDIDDAPSVVDAFVAKADRDATVDDVQTTPDGQRITVTLTVTYHTGVLWMFGYDTLTVTGRATATLLNTA